MMYGTEEEPEYDVRMARKAEDNLISQSSPETTETMSTMLPSANVTHPSQNENGKLDLVSLDFSITLSIAYKILQSLQIAGIPSRIPTMHL